MWGEARWERRKENEGLQISSLSLSVCHAPSSQVAIFPHSLRIWRTTCSLNCIWVSCHDRMRSWIKGLLGSDWLKEFCELLWSHYTHCHLRMSLKFQTHLVLEQKPTKTTGKKTNPYLVVLSMKKEVNGYPKWIIGRNVIDEVKQEAMQAVFNKWPQQQSTQKQSRKNWCNLSLGIHKIRINVLNSIPSSQILNGQVAHI